MGREEEVDGEGGGGLWSQQCPQAGVSWQWAGVLSRLALEQERILNPVLDRVRTADHHQLRSLTGLIRNLSRHARNKDEMCECWGPGLQGSARDTLCPPIATGGCEVHPQAAACPWLWPPALM